MKFIFYSPAFGPPWDYSDLETGIGGSEQYHIEMAVRLARRGHQVVSYNNLAGEPRQHLGIDWRRHDFLKHDAPHHQKGIWVVQREPVMADAFTARREDQILWHVYHDVDYALPGKDGATWLANPERMARYDRLLALSPFHAEFLSNQGHANVTRSGGGIAVDRMAAIEADTGVLKSMEKLDRRALTMLPIIRDPHRIVFTSAPDRGLLYALRCFGRAKEHIADLKLDVYYGWSGYDQRMAVDQTGCMARQKEEMQRLLEQPGITWHGKVSQTELWRGMLAAGLWLYPTEYPEIFCAAAAEAQALGCIPVCSLHWALRDTVFAGVKLEGPCWTDRLCAIRFPYTVVALAKHPEAQEQIRGAMMEKARDQYDWERVCDQFEDLATQDLGRKQVVSIAKPPAPKIPRPANGIFVKRRDGTLWGGWFGPENERNLERLIRQHEVKTVLEIGSFLGYSAVWFAERVEHVWCIDTFTVVGEKRGLNNLVLMVEDHGLPQHFGSMFQRNLEAEGVADKVTIIQGNSLDVAPMAPEVDLVYIDGDHSLEGCEADILAYLSKAKKVICGDDYTRHFPGVLLATKELLPAHRSDGPFWWMELGAFASGGQA